MKNVIQRGRQGLILWVLPLFFAFACLAGDDTVACRQYSNIPVALSSGQAAQHIASAEPSRCAPTP
jgi:hypothetical protein